MLQLGTVDTAVSGKDKAFTWSQTVLIHKHAAFIPHKGCSMTHESCAKRLTLRSIAPLFLQSLKSTGPLTLIIMCCFLMNSTALYKWNKKTKLGRATLSTVHLITVRHPPPLALLLLSSFTWARELHSPCLYDSYLLLLAHHTWHMS